MNEPTDEPNAQLLFPDLAARDLEGRARALPTDFSGARNLVIIAFRREQQAMVDTWVTWFESVAARHPTLRCYEVPVIATRWSPGRRIIDGGMAQAVGQSDARRRTLTVYTDVRRVTDALAIEDPATVTVMLVDSDGLVLWRTAGPVTERTGSDLLATLGVDADDGDRDGQEWPAIEQFEFNFDPRFRPLLALLGITPGTAHVSLTPERLVAHLGPWTCESPIDNVREVCRTGPYQSFKAIGPRGSLTDRGLTFGTTAKGGVCVLFTEPVPGLAPISLLRHPGITLTLLEPERFATSLRRRAGLE